MFDLGTKEANKALTTFLSDKYAKACKDLCIDASNSSIGWLHLWKDKEKGQYKYAVIPSGQIIPIWSKNLEKELKGVLRCYHDVTDEGVEQDIYEYWNDKMCQSYAVEAGDTIDEGLIPNHTFTVVDVYCKVFSGFVNDLEDIQEVIFVLTNYGGQDLGQFLRDLKDYKAIQIDSDGAEDKSGVSTLTIELPVEARKELLTVTRKCIFEQGQGIDPDPQNFGNSSGVALGFLYSLLELKAGLQETEFKLGFGQFVRCACRLMGIAIKDDTITQTWTRTSVKNDQETAGIAQQSKGVISDETIVKNHPWVEDPEAEVNRLKSQEQEARKEISEMFPQSEEEPKEPETGGEA